MNLTRLKKEFEDRPIEFTAVVTAAVMITAVITVSKIINRYSDTHLKAEIAKQIIIDKFNEK